MKKIGELLNKKQWRWTAAGVLCLVIAMTIFALGAGIGVQAENVDLGNGESAVSFDVATDGSYLIKDASQMTALGKATNGTNGKTFRLNNDIEMTVSNAAAGVFEGTFDGNGHVITISSVSGLTSSGTDTADSEGLLFGTVKGTVKNLIVDVSAKVSYTRTSKVSRGAAESSTISVTTDATAPYSDTNTFSAKSGDTTAKALAAEFDGWTTTDHADDIISDDGQTYYRKAMPEDITNTRTYSLKDTKTDQFGILCGTLESSGKIEKVYVKGSEEVTVTQAAEKVATKTTQTGKRDKYFYYKQTKQDYAEDVTAQTATAAARKITLYDSTKKASDTVTGSNAVKMDISVPFYHEKNENLVYTVKVTNTSSSEIELTDIKASVNGNGTWKKGTTEITVWSGKKLAVNASEDYTYTISNVENDISAEKFTLTYSYKTAGATEASTGTAATTSGVSTSVVDVADVTENSSSATGLQLILTPQKANYLVSNGTVNVPLTLTLKNNMTKPASVDDVELTVAAADITLKLREETKTIEWFNETQKFQTNTLKCGESVTLKGTLNLNLTQGQASTEYNNLSVSVKPSQQKNIQKNVNTYQYVSNIEGNSVLPQYGAEDYTGNSETDAEDSKVSSGNALNAGIIAGTSKGSITQTKQEMTISGTKSDTENAAALKVGGIVGAAESSASASDIYIWGTQNYAGEESTLPESSALISATEKPNNVNWASYEKYTSASASETAFDLAWLVESQNVFTYSEPISKKITVDINAKKTSKKLSYAVAYHARKAMNDSSEDTVYFTDTKEIELGDSGYYRLLNTYATDGYYHYTTPVTALSDAEFVYPYDSSASYYAYEAKLVRTPDSVKDQVQITLKKDQSTIAKSGTIYYEVNSEEIPVDTSSHVQLTNGNALLPFEITPAEYVITPVIDSVIYPSTKTQKFTAEDREPLPKPAITCFDYYKADGTENSYQPLGLSNSYEAGTSMKITPTNDSETNDAYTIRYLFSVSNDPLGGDQWTTDGRYTGSDAIMNGAKEYQNSAKIPETLSGNVYLYVEISKRNYPSSVYRYGPITVTEQVKIKTSLNGDEKEEGIVLKDDVVKLSMSNGGTNTIQYYPSLTKLSATVTASEWKDYAANGLKIPELSGEAYYIYARIKYDGEKYSEQQLFTFTIGTASAEPTITPPTGLASSGTMAASPIEATDKVELSGATTASVFYMASDRSQDSIQIERTSEVPQQISGNGMTDGQYTYYQIGSRWYRTTNAKLYSDGIYLSHTDNQAKYMYISAVAIQEDYEISSVRQYIYKVQPKKKAGDPQASLATYYTPGGTDLEKTSVSKGSKLTFFSETQNVDLFYAIKGTGQELARMDAEGVEVTGNYGEDFTIIVQTRSQNNNMDPSNTLEFTYLISEQEMVNAPTATPGTGTETPATVIPGNKILLSTSTKGASIFYTTDGSSPKVKEENGGYSAEDDKTTLYDPTKGIEMPQNGSGYFTITAVAVKSGLGASPEVRFPYVYPQAVMAPYANISSGKVALNTKVLLKNLTEGATIYYNAAYGSNAKEDELEEPTLSSIVYSEGYAFTIQQKTIIKAMAVKDGVKSAVVTLIYEPLAQLAAPTASIETGSVVSNGTILYLKAASGASIYYTIDGSDPTDGTNKAVMLGNSVTLHGEPGGQITIKAYAKAENSSQSEVAMFTYQFSQNSMGGVTASVASGSIVSNGTKIILMSDLTGAEIYYTTNGESPVDHGIKGTTVEVNGTPGASFTIKAVARSDQEAGIVVTFIYKIKEKPEKPTASPGGGTLTVAARVSLDSGEETIYYTTDGTDPTKSSKLYSEPILINRTTTLKAIAVSADGEMSEIASYYYLAAAKAAMPRSDQQTGKILEPGSRITLTSDTPDAQIYYTTDGTDPTVNNLDQLLVYEEDGIEIFRSVTIKAVAYTEDMRMSNVSSFDYIVDTIPAAELKREEAERLAEEGLKDTDASALTRKNQSADTRKAACKLEEKEVNVIAADHVKTLFGEDHKILVQYDVSLNLGRNDLSQEDAEISLPIPDGYENATLTVAALDSQNKLTTLESRREGGMLYVKAVSAGDYVIIGPKESTESSRSFSYLLPLEIASGSVLLAGIGYYANMKWKKIKIRKKTTQTSDEL